MAALADRTESPDVASPGAPGRVPTLVRLLLAVVAGSALVVAFPPYDLWPLAPIAVATLTLLVRNTTWLITATIGALFGLSFFMGLMPWLRVIGLDAWLALSALCALFLVVLALGIRILMCFPAWPVTTAALWVTVEALRDRIPFGGFPWGRLAFANGDSSYTGWAAVGGAPAVTFVVALSAALLVVAVLQARSRNRPRAVAALVSVVLIALSGLLIPRPVDGAPVVAAVVQGNVPRTGMDAFGQREAVLNGHVEATYELTDQIAAGEVRQPDLVIWPENASDIDPVLDESAFERIDSVVQAVDTPTLVGLVAATPDGQGLLNSGVVWSPTSGPGQRYVKRHPVPFGEYVPFRSTLSRFISRFDRVPRDFVAGDAPGVLTMGPVVVGDVICFEVAFDEVVRDVVKGGGEVITVQTNNATYGRTGQVEQQLALSQLRAVEHGRAVLVAATSGISAVIGPDGRILARTTEFTQDVLVEEIPRRDALTLATRLGAWPELGLAIVSITALVLAVRRTRRDSSA